MAIGSGAPSVLPSTRRAATAAAARLFKTVSYRKPFRPLRLVESGRPRLKLNTDVANILVPSDRTSPSCLCCTQASSWEEMIQGSRQLQLGISGAYAFCHECSLKNSKSLPENKQWLVAT
jgi:hypothetical protein